ncbi:MAG: hypothetical protein LC808_35115, partial [Actinobacteria bacterium]|nr:hypothetical protein [Actinomycetota bacterium]
MCSRLVRALARRGGALSGAVIVSLAAALAACSSQGAPPDSPGSQPTGAGAAPPSSSAPPSPADAATEQAKAAYMGMWQAMAKAGETSDWQSPQLARYATGNALTTITRSLYADHVNRVVTRGMPTTSPQVSSVDPPNAPVTVMISDCGDSTNWLKYREGTTELVDDEPGGRHSIVAEVNKQVDGLWRVSQFA